MANNIIIKQLWPKALMKLMITSGVALILTGAMISVNVYETKVMKDQTIPFMISYAWLTLLFFGAVLPIFTEYKTHQNFISTAISDFIKTETEKNKELQYFQHVLQNKQALTNVTNILSNSLQKSEQQVIINALTNMVNREYNSKKEAREAVVQTKKTIVEILQKHATIHPEFIREIYTALAYANTSYVLTSIQHTK